MFAAEWGTGQVFWSMVWFFLFIMWIWLLVVVFSDIFRSRDLSGWSKALWSLFVLVLPYLGVFVYVIARGSKMTEHAMDSRRREAEMYRTYAGDLTTAATSDVDQLEKLASLKQQGLIDDDEYIRMKGRLTGGMAAI